MHKNYMNGESPIINLNRYEEFIASYVNIKKPFLVNDKIRLIIIQKITQTAAPFISPRIPPNVLLISPIKLKENSLFNIFARTLTTNKRTTTKITDTATEINLLTAGLTKEFIELIS